MRLPFGLGRRSSSGDGAENGDSDTGLATADASSTPAAPTRAWASLPPIQRTAGDMPMVAEPGRFAGALPGSQGLPPIVQALGHEVSPLATPGLVVARVRPMEVASTATIPAPVQRRAARGSQAASVQAIAAPAAPDLDEPFATAGPAAAPELQPIRTMPAVSRQSVHVPDRPLTSAAMAARPAAVQRAEAAAATASTGPLPLPSSGGMRRVPSGTPPAGMPVVSRQAAATKTEPSAPAAQATTLPAATAATSATSTALAPAAASAPVRRGLGEPLVSLPPSARPVGSPAASPVVSRSTAAGPMPIAASSLRAAVQRSAAVTVAASPPSPSGSGAAAAAAPGVGAAPRAGVSRLPELSHLPVARSSAARSATASPSSTPSASTASETAAAPAAHARPAGSTSSAAASPTSAAGSSLPLPVAAGPAVQALAAPEIRPIASANPIRPSFSIQRSASDADDDDDGAEEPSLPSPWWAPATESHPASGAYAGASRDAGPASIQRSASRDASPAASSESFGSRSGPGGQSGRAPATIPSAQRASAPAGLPLPPARGAATEVSARSASATTAASPSVAGGTAPGPVPGVTAAPVVQTSPMAGGAGSAHRSISFPQTPTVQRVGSEPGSSPSGPAAPAAAAKPAHSERDLDELAQALFSRIRTRLRSDLIHEREAKGLTFDNV